MRFGLILAEVGNGLRRNLSMVISVILVTFVSLTFVGTAILLQTQIGQMKSYWYDRAQVVVYLCNGLTQKDGCAEGSVTDAQRASVQALLDSDTLGSFIESVEFEDQQAAFERYVEQFPDLTELVSPELMSESFWVKLTNPDQSQVIVDALSGYAGVESVLDQRGLLSDVFAIMNTASYTAIGIAGLMLIAAALLISTTIRLSAFSRRRELSIMRLVGASNRFIQTPFILEGVVAALIGSLLAGFAILGIVVIFVKGYLQPGMPGTNLVGVPEALVVMPILLVVGAVIAAFSAGFAINRYLRV